jgi:YfiH family protein
MNRSIFFQQLHISEKQAVFPEQVHSDDVEVVYTPGIVKKCDALITNTKNLFLTIQTADCFPIFLFEPLQQTAAVIHSGWRGTAKNIAGKTVEIMIKEFHCSPEKIYAGIGPGVLQECYQVDRAAADFFGKDSLKPDGPDHFKLDIQGVIIKQLLEAGISRNNLEIENTCTYCAEDLFYSHRRDVEQSGRMMGVIGIRS